jgi:hypothetical protein
MKSGEFCRSSDGVGAYERKAPADDAAEVKFAE